MMLKISPNGLGCLKKSDPNHHLRDCEANLVHYLVFILSSSSSAPFNDRLIVSCHIPCSSFHPHALSHAPLLHMGWQHSAQEESACTGQCHPPAHIQLVRNIVQHTSSAPTNWMVRWTGSCVSLPSLGHATVVNSYISFHVTML